MSGETNQWAPYLFQDHKQIFPFVGKPGWNLTTAMADEAIFANQKRLGVVPPGTELTAWPDTLPKWETLTPEQKKLYVRQAEVFAAYAAYTDHEIGRVIQEIRDQGKFDNTIVIYISGDNGTSAEGTLTGTYNTYVGYNGMTEVPLAAKMAHYEEWGLPGTDPHMAVPWAWAFDTPFKWTKQVASHFGGTRQGMSISWPKMIKDKGGIRSQFHHVIDIVPTLLEAGGIDPPDMVNGVKQAPIEGVSMMFTFDKANESGPSRRTTQYFGMGGYRGIYHEGWYAATTPPITPWSPVLGVELPDVLTGYSWELYDLGKDFSQAHDVAAENPEKLKELQAIFDQEARKCQVYPLDNRAFMRFVTPWPSATAGRSEFVHSGEIQGIPAANAPPFLSRSFTITAGVDVPEGGAEGMIATQGGATSGYGLYLLAGKPVFSYNLLDLQRFRWEGPALAPGKHQVVFDFTYLGPGLGKGGKGVLSVDGTQVDAQEIPATIPFSMPLDETFDVGVDTRSGVNDADYALPFHFTGNIEKLTFKVGPQQLRAP